MAIPYTCIYSMPTEKAKFLCQAKKKATVILPKFPFRYVRIANEILMHFRAQKKLAAEISLNDTIDVDRDGNPLTYIDVISCDESMPSDIERKISSAKALRLVNTLLTARERKIIVLRYGLNGKKPLTQREIAEALNISRSYVSRIEKSALEKLKAEL